MMYGRCDHPRRYRFACQLLEIKTVQHSLDVPAEPENTLARSLTFLSIYRGQSLESPIFMGLFNVAQEIQNVSTFIQLRWIQRARHGNEGCRDQPGTIHVRNRSRTEWRDWNACTDSGRHIGGAQQRRISIRIEEVGA